MDRQVVAELLNFCVNMYTYVQFGFTVLKVDKAVLEGRILTLTLPKQDNVIDDSVELELDCVVVSRHMVFRIKHAADPKLYNVTVKLIQGVTYE